MGPDVVLLRASGLTRERAVMVLFLPIPANSHKTITVS